MSKALKTVMVCLLLLTMPLQGFAAATMISCAPLPQERGITIESASSLSHHHAEASDLSFDNSGSHNHAAGTHSDHGHVPSKCGTCAACCSSVAMTPSTAATQFHLSSVEVISGYIPAFHGSLPDALERPPRLLS